ncbi:MAG TPA: transketolase [Oscillibacter sp.]|jgi:transketolase|nr:transketolase [Oscillibacter sp.]HCL20548.1 transketolase [Oscillibacter sp.]
MLTNEKREALQSMATQLRRDVIEMTYKAQSGHPGGSCSLADIMAYLYFNRMRYDVNEPKALKRDRLVLSKGHAAPIWYAALAEAGFFPREEMLHLREIGHLLQGHPCVHIPGVDATTGSLGFGLSIAVGMAAAAKMDGLDVKVHAIVGDGEQGEGQIWEAAMAAPNLKLDNLTVILDRNKYQNDGRTEDIMPLEPLADKWRAFNWNVVEIDGHDLDQIDAAFAAADACKGRPTLIYANTIKGKGCSYMLDQPQLHYTPPTKEQYESALEELKGSRWF